MDTLACVQCWVPFMTTILVTILKRALDARPFVASLIGSVMLSTAVTQRANAEIVSFAFVQPHGTLRVSGGSIRLYGVYVPPTEQSCRTFERPIECGTRASLALDFHIGVEFVHCEAKVRHHDGSLTAL